MAWILSECWVPGSVVDAEDTVMSEADKPLSMWSLCVHRETGDRLQVSVAGIVWPPTAADDSEGWVLEGQGEELGFYLKCKKNHGAGKVFDQGRKLMFYVFRRTHWL